MSSLREYEKRLEALEEAYKPWEDREMVVIFRLSFQYGEVIALEGNGITVNRLTGETEQQLYDRTMIEIRKTPPSWPSAKDDKVVYMLNEIRENIELPENWWRADPMGTSGAYAQPNTGKEFVARQPKSVAVAPAPVVTPDPVRDPEPKPETKPSPRPAPREVVEARREYGSGIQHWMMG